MFDTEILVVDSYSTDGTVELAKEFPATILQLGRDWPHSPSAGRFTAVNHAKGRYLLLIDGDMELLPCFISEALAHLEADPSVVAVRGRLNNFHAIDGNMVYVNSKFATCICTRDSYVDSSNPVSIDYASGSAIFRLQSVLEAGNFHPFLKAEEEYEISQRLRAQGGKLVYLPIDSVNHYGYLSDPLKEVGRRLRRGLVGGIGQMARISFEEGYGRKNLYRFRVQILISSFFLLIIPSLLAAWAAPLVPLIWLALAITLIMIYWWKKGTLCAALAACFQNTLIGVDIFKGVFTRVPERETYPTGVTIITSMDTILESR